MSMKRPPGIGGRGVQKSLHQNDPLNLWGTPLEHTFKAPQPKEGIIGLIQLSINLIANLTM